MSNNAVVTGTSAVREAKRERYPSFPEANAKGWSELN
jgi:hypothetical protein